jgi:predicted nucleic-acid-binding protein
VKITPDTNILVRVLVGDDAQQSCLAEAILEHAEVVALTLPTLCELAWVLSRAYKIGAHDIADRIRRIAESTNVVVNRRAVEAGLETLDSGGDFADGVIAYEGRWLGGETFVSFDRRAVKSLTGQGKKAVVPA